MEAWLADRTCRDKMCCTRQTQTTLPGCHCVVSTVVFPLWCFHCSVPILVCSLDTGGLDITEMLASLGLASLGLASLGLASLGLARSAG